MEGHREAFRQSLRKVIEAEILTCEQLSNHSDAVEYAIRIKTLHWTLEQPETCKPE